MEGPHNHSKNFLRLLRENPDITLEELVKAGYGDVPADSIAKKDYLVTIKDGEEWLKENPDAKSSNIPVAYYRVLSETYGGLKNAKRELGITDSILQQRKAEFDKLLKEHPRYSYKELTKEHKYVLRNCYQNKLNVARKELGLTRTYGPKPKLSDIPRTDNYFEIKRRELEMRHNDFENWLRSKPNASNKEVLSKYRDVIDTLYDGSVKKARIELESSGINTKNERYTTKRKVHKPYSDEEIKALKTEFDEFMKSHINAVSKDVRDKYNPVIVRYYENSLVKAREVLEMPSINPSGKGRPKISAEEMQKREAEFYEWLRNNPDSKCLDIPGKYMSLLSRLNKTVGEAKKELGIEMKRHSKKYSAEEIELMTKKFHEALIKNPEMKAYEVPRDCSYVLNRVYRYSINSAKKAAGIDVYEKKARQREEKRLELMGWLKQNPNATHKEIRKFGYKKIIGTCYNGNIGAAKEDAGTGNKCYRGAEIPELKGVEFEINRLGLEKIKLWEVMNDDYKNSWEARVLRMFKLRSRKQEDVPQFLRAPMVYAIIGGYLQRKESPAIFSVYLASKNSLENMTVQGLQSKLKEDYHSSEIEGALVNLGYYIRKSKHGRIIVKRR